eukprot:GFYU01010412.1.p1 GENE.GFYU01010412.1~~GFYU01010412.1.p1  ORF type:complete len:178 (+),score=50.90 GFYU01010412.1:1-534(+)
MTGKPGYKIATIPGYILLASDYDFFAINATRINVKNPPKTVFKYEWPEPKTGVQMASHDGVVMVTAEDKTLEMFEEQFPHYKEVSDPLYQHPLFIGGIIAVCGWQYYRYKTRGSSKKDEDGGERPYEGRSTRYNKYRSASGGYSGPGVGRPTGTGYGNVKGYGPGGSGGGSRWGGAE